MVSFIAVYGISIIHFLAPWLTTRLVKIVPRGSTVLPKSVTPSRIESNLKLVKLDDEDVKQLNAYGEDLEKNGQVQRFVYPPFGIDFGFPDKS